MWLSIFGVCLLIATFGSYKALGKDNSFEFIASSFSAIFFAFLFFEELSKYRSTINDFFGTVFTWVFWILVVVIAVFIIRYIGGVIIERNDRKRYLNHQNRQAIVTQQEEEKEHQRIEKERIREREQKKIEEERKQQEAVDRKERQKLIIESDYQRKILIFESLQKKNQQAEEDIKFLKYAVSKLNIFDGDKFLEDQPELLDYINNSIRLNKGD